MRCLHTARAKTVLFVYILVVIQCKSIMSAILVYNLSVDEYPEHWLSPTIA